MSAAAAQEELSRAAWWLAEGQAPVLAHQLPAHRMLLTQRSSRFRSLLLTSGMRENFASDVTVLGVEPDALYALLRYLYCDTVDDGSDAEDDEDEGEGEAAGADVGAGGLKGPSGAAGSAGDAPPAGRLRSFWARKRAPKPPSAETASLASALLVVAQEYTLTRLAKLAGGVMLGQLDEGNAEQFLEFAETYMQPQIRAAARSLLLRAGSGRSRDKADGAADGAGAAPAGLFGTCAAGAGRDMFCVYDVAPRQESPGGGAR